MVNAPLKTDSHLMFCSYPGGAIRRLHIQLDLGALKDEVCNSSLVLIWLFIIAPPKKDKEKNMGGDDIIMTI